MGRLEEPTHLLRKALDIDPTFWVARRELGIIDWQLKKKDQAANELRAIVKLFPDDSAVNAILGQYESEHGNYPQASAYFEKANVEVAPDVGLSLIAAEAYVKTGKQSRAKDILGFVANSRIRRIRALDLRVNSSPDYHGRWVQTTDFELCNTSEDLPVTRQGYP